MKIAKIPTAGCWLCLLIVILLQACGSDNENPNPCDALEPVNANFVMGQRLTNHSGTDNFLIVDTLIVSDTVLAWNFIEFAAPGGYDRYEWIIGNNDQVFTDSVVRLRFGDEFFPGEFDQLPIQLIVESTPSTCFPEDDGIDTVTQYLTILGKLETAVYGRYRGHLKSNPTDTFTISYVIERDEYDFPTIFMNNINKGCMEDGWFNHALAYKDVSFTNWATFGAGCNDPSGWIHLADNLKDVTIEFSTGKLEDEGYGPRYYDTFIGTRIN